MFGISFEEMLVLLVLALILFGPDKLPEYAEKMGRWVAKMRQAGQEVRDSYRSALQTAVPATPAWGYCVYCGKHLEQDFTFCPFCGQRLKPEPYPSLAEADQIPHDTPIKDTTPGTGNPPPKTG
jgi:hypothetical protein